MFSISKILFPSHSLPVVESEERLKSFRDLYREGDFAELIDSIKGFAENKASESFVSCVDLEVLKKMGEVFQKSVDKNLKDLKKHFAIYIKPRDGHFFVVNAGALHACQSVENLQQLLQKMKPSVAYLLGLTPSALAARVRKSTKILQSCQRQIEKRELQIKEARAFLEDPDQR